MGRTVWDVQSLWLSSNVENSNKVEDRVRNFKFRNRLFMRCILICIQDWHLPVEDLRVDFDRETYRSPVPKGSGQEPFNQLKAKIPGNVSMTGRPSETFSLNKDRNPIHRIVGERRNVRPDWHL